MYWFRIAISSVAVVAAFGGAVRDCEAGWTFIGPTPYLSKADSPFPIDGSNPNFYLEDFEDGLLNTLGIFQPLLPITHASVRRPSEFTDSVDADDGSIDDFGQLGHSIGSNAYVVFPIDPPFSWSYMRFGFDYAELGYYPTAFGFTWTDGLAPNKVLIEAFDNQWQLLSQHEFDGLGDLRLSGEAAEDRFLGFTSTTPFAYVQITSKYAGAPYTFEIDHVQYGGIGVAEPASGFIAVIVLALILWKRSCFISKRLH